MTTIGELKYEIVIQSPSTTRNTYGEVNLSTSWSDVFTRWAKMDFKKGKETEIGMERTSTDVYEFTFRSEFNPTDTWSQTIPNNYRVKVFGGTNGDDRYFDIEGGGYVGGHKEFYKLICVEKDS